MQHLPGLTAFVRPTWRARHAGSIESFRHNSFFEGSIGDRAFQTIRPAIHLNEREKKIQIGVTMSK
jgi:hypothetical protein